MLQLPRNAGESRRCVYGRTVDDVQRRWLEATGQGPVRVRPGSISEFVVTHFTAWILGRVQPDSFHRYDVAWRTHLGPTLGHLLFDELTVAGIQDAISEGVRAPASREMAKGLLGQIVKLAITERRCDPATLHMVSMAKVGRVRSRQRRDVTEKARAMLRKAEQTGHWLEGMIYAGSVVGLRKGEACGVKITDLVDGCLVLQRQRNHTSGERDRLKHREQGEVRRIGLPPAIFDRLRSYWDGKSVYLFTRPDGRPIDYNHVGRHMEALQGPEPITFHDLRSAAIVNLIEARANDHTIMDLMGQGSLDVIRRYRDDSEKRTREALGKVDG